MSKGRPVLSVCAATYARLRERSLATGVPIAQLITAMVARHTPPVRQ